MNHDPEQMGKEFLIGARRAVWHIEPADADDTMQNAFLWFLEHIWLKGDQVRSIAALATTITREQVRRYIRTRARQQSREVCIDLFLNPPSEQD